MLVHATTIDVAGCGVLLVGESGSGKSDLALRLMADGALLVADDQTVVEAVGDALHASAPGPIVGLIEVRGVGIVPAGQMRATRLKLAVRLIDAVPERMPEPGTWSLPGMVSPAVALVELRAFEASVAAKVRATLALVLNA